MILKVHFCFVSIAAKGYAWQADTKKCYEQILCNVLLKEIKIIKRKDY